MMSTKDEHKNVSHQFPNLVEGDYMNVVTSGSWEELEQRERMNRRKTNVDKKACILTKCTYLHTLN
jgi:hypothetical protein